MGTFRPRRKWWPSTPALTLQIGINSLDSHIVMKDMSAYIAESLLGYDVFEKAAKEAEEKKKKKETDKKKKQAEKKKKESAPDVSDKKEDVSDKKEKEAV
ncbi:MAG: hypothetical protein U9P10_01735 [Thermodesulfobacteriota bacterium]|nr:hypothetical protein [Thermodesulfobacteriota bacterium]